MFWKKSKESKQPPSSKSTTTTTSYRTDGGMSSSGNAVTSYQSKVKSSSKGTSSKTTITVTTKQTVSQKSNFSEVTKTYTQIGSALPPIGSTKWTTSSTALSPALASSSSSGSSSIFQRQKTEPSIVRRQDAIGYNPKYISPYRTGNLATQISPILPASGTTTTTKTITYVSPYANSSLREKKTLEPSRTSTSVGTALFASAPKSKSSTIWNPMSSLEQTKPSYTARAYSPAPVKASNPPPSTPYAQTRAPTVAVSAPPSVAKRKLGPGVVVIFHNDKFDNPNKEFRVGSAEDVYLLKKTFQALKMSVTVHENLTVREVDRVVQKIETRDFGKASCIVIVILSHGTRYETVAAKDDSYSVDDNVLFPILRNRSLRSKPKLLFIQACKGAMEVGKFHKDAIQPTSAPDEILKCYSTFEGYVAYRTEKGSPFIQALCGLLQEYGKSKNIKDIMDMVIKRVKDKTESKQIPSYETTLTEPYCFGDFV